MPIQNQEISDSLEDVRSVLESSKRWAAAQPAEALGAHLATYVAVYLLGVVEDSIETLLEGRARKPNDECVANYICQDIEHFRNPKRHTIGEALKKFSPEFADRFYNRFPERCREITALESIYSVKTDLAHKGTDELRLTLPDVEDYINRIEPILEVLESILS